MPLPWSSCKSWRSILEKKLMTHYNSLMKILSAYASFEINIKNSRFLAELFPCEKQDQARAIVKAQKNKYFDSTHVVHAFMLGLKGEVMGMSDDGEPGGTAGRPVLDVIKGRDCTNLVLTVTRWFGGTLLGTGGLVKAYGDAAKGVMEKAEKANLLQEYVEKADFSFSVDYGLHKSIKKCLEDFEVMDINEEFSDKVRISGKIISEKKEAFFETIKNLSAGKIIL